MSFVRPSRGGAAAALLALAAVLVATPAARARGPRLDADGPGGGSVTMEWLPLARGPYGHLHVRARLGGSEPLWFVVDTAAAGSLVAAEVARRLELPAGEPGIVRTIHGDQEVAGRVGTVAVGGLPAVETRFSEMTLPWSIDGEPVAGLLGRDVLGRFAVAIDVAAPRLGMGARFDAARLGLDAPAGAWRTLVLEEGHPVIEARFEGRAARFKLDTGAPGEVYLFLPYVERERLLDGRTTEEAIVHGGMTVRRGSLDGFEVGGVALGRVGATFGATGLPILAGDDVAGVVGLGLLRRLVVVLDYPGERILLLPATGAA